MDNQKKDAFHSEQFPTLTKITDDIYRVVVRYPFGMYEMNSYLIKGIKGFTIIDTGSESKESMDIWKKIFNSGISIEKLVITHAHSDHIGLAKWFQNQYKITVFLSDLGYKEIQRKRSYDNSSWLRNLLSIHDSPDITANIGTSEDAAFEFEPDELFESNQLIKIGDQNYETIWTPGHSPDHFCFYNPKQQVMVTGDHVLAELSPIIAVWSEEDKNPIKDNFSSLERLKGYSTKLVLPGHGKLIFNLDNRLDELISGHKQRLNEILLAVSENEKTSWQVCQELYGSSSTNKFFAPLLATITRFIYLQSIGKVSSEIRDGKLYYQSI